MAGEAVREIKNTVTDAQILRYTVPGIKDLPVAAKKLIEEKDCDLVLAFGMPGPTSLDRQSAHEANLGLIWAQLLTNKHVIVVFVHEEEAADEQQLHSICVDRARKHAQNAVKLLFHPEQLITEAGTGKRQGYPDAQPIRIER